MFLVTVMTRLRYENVRLQNPVVQLIWTVRGLAKTCWVGSLDKLCGMVEIEPGVY